MSVPTALFVVGARPNFVKVGPILTALAARGDVRALLLHTGQHYDPVLSDSFLAQLEFPPVDFALGVGSGSHAQQTGAVMLGIEQILAEHHVDGVVVPGDINSTMGATLAAAKAGVRVAHVESGLRSRDPGMPEEVNRVVTDRLSDLLLCHSPDGVENLRAEGVPEERIALVGNTMIDSLLRLYDAGQADAHVRAHGVEPGGYALVTLHRPALVDDPARLGAVLDVLGELAERLPVIFPVHPRTRARLAAAGVAVPEGVELAEPLPYDAFVGLQGRARLVVTDSGGVQEETSALGVRCFTYRDNTERPITVTAGTNTLVGVDPEVLRRALSSELDAPRPAPAEPIPLWDGRAGERAAAAIAAWLEGARAGAFAPRLAA